MYTNNKDCQFEMLVTNVAIDNVQRKLQKINIIRPRPLPESLPEIQSVGLKFKQPERGAASLNMIASTSCSPAFLGGRKVNA